MPGPPLATQPPLLLRCLRAQCFASSALTASACSLSTANCSGVRAFSWRVARERAAAGGRRQACVELGRFRNRARPVGTIEGRVRVESRLVSGQEGAVLLVVLAHVDVGLGWRGQEGRWRQGQHLRNRQKGTTTWRKERAEG